MKNGLLEYFYDGGGLSHYLNYVDGVLHGRYEAYYENATLRERGCYVDGKMDGVWELHYDYGLFIRGEFDMDVAVGEWQVWESDGTSIIMNSISRDHTAEQVKGTSQL
tara:strand:- start:5369 stop:5692 length:324 start_codon:yes stop_codon:yes gene_type:complete